MEKYIVEIRGGAGGDEGNIFAGDLYRMYCRYAESKGWKIELYSIEPCAQGGYSKIIVSFRGEGTSVLMNEAGVHRVQRVPKTEKRGRIQTSTATVAVYPEQVHSSIQLNSKDLQITVHHSSGAGGQNVNKVASAVRVKYLPTGETVDCQVYRDQPRNKELALTILRSCLASQKAQEAQSNLSSTRKAQIGSGDRAEKIRTYNYPNNRVTDHVHNKKYNKLDEIMNGDLDIIYNNMV